MSSILLIIFTHLKINKKIMDSKKSRNRIFDPINQISYAEPKRTVSNIIKARTQYQSPTAEQQLRQSLYFQMSIRTVLDQVREYKQYYKGYVDGAEKKKQQIENVNKLIFDEKLVLQKLYQYHEIITKMQEIAVEYNEFQINCITNIRQDETHINFSLDSKQAQDQILMHLDKIDELRYILQQKLVRFQYQIHNETLNRFQNLDSIITELRNYVQNNRSVINMLMLNVLRSLRQAHQQFSTQIEYHKQYYFKFENITDSMSTMKLQSDNMKKLIVQMKKHFGDIVLSQKSKSFQAVIHQRETFKQNLKLNSQIYQSNYKIFTKNSSQTNVEQYQQYLREYRRTHVEFQKQYDEYTKLGNSFDILYRNKIRGDEYAKKAIGSDSNKTDVQNLKKIYFNTLLVDADKQLFVLKQNILSTLQRDLKKLNIILPQRQPLNIENNLFKQKIKTFIEYFNQLNIYGLNYLASTRSEVELYFYELVSIQKLSIIQNQSKSQQQTNVENIRYYRRAFQLLLKIAKIHQELKKDNYNLININFKISNPAILLKFITESLISLDQFCQKQNYYRGIPVGLERVLFSYVKDLVIMTQISTILEDLKKKLTKFSLQYYKSIKKNTPSFYFQQPEDVIIPDKAIEKEKIIQLVRLIGQIHDDNHLIRNVFIKKLTKTYSFYLIEIFNQILTQNYVKAFIEAGQQQFFHLNILAFIWNLGETKKVFLPNILVLIQRTLKQIFSVWKKDKFENKWRKFIKLSLIQSILQITDQKNKKYAYYRQILAFVLNLCLLNMEIQSIAPTYNKLSKDRRNRTNLYLLKVLNEMAELNFNPTQLDDEIIEFQINRFSINTKQQSLILLAKQANVKRILNNLKIIVADIDLQKLSSFAHSDKIVQLALVYHYLTNINNFKINFQKLRQVDRIKVYDGTSNITVNFKNQSDEIDRIIREYSLWAEQTNKFYKNSLDTFSKYGLPHLNELNSKFTI